MKNLEVGQKYGRLTAIKYSHSTHENRVKYWIFECECGNMKAMPKNNVTNGRTVSCGCFRLENLIKRSTKHGGAKRKKRERLNSIWADMRKRCRGSYKNYGLKGIKVCKEWDESYAIFKEWAMNNGYNDRMSIERIDVNKNYYPDNCKWITMKNQAKNKSNSRIIKYNGIEMCAARWAKAYDIPYKTFHKRLQSGWEIERALGVK